MGDPAPTVAAPRGRRGSVLAVQTLAADPAAPRSDLLAAIDIGSNSIHMILAEPVAGGGFRVVDKEKDMVRLGRSALTHGRLSDDAIERGLVTLTRMITLARLKGVRRLVAVATSAVREAANGEAFLERIRAQTGLEVQVLTGLQEGRLIFRAVREAVDLGEGPAVIVDIGGGSSEWIVTQQGRFESVESLRLGSLRCSAWLSGDPPGKKSLKRLRETVRDALAALPKGPPVAALVATSGTAEACADLATRLRGQAEVTVSSGLREIKPKELDAVVDLLRRRERSEIAALPPISAPRAESIVAGAVLLQELTRHCGAARILVSDRALRDGLVLEVLGRPLEALPEPGQLRRQQVRQLAQRAESVYPHAETTARLATRLFDLTQSVHGLGGREREWLEAAALLHDLGYLVDYQRHHRHAYYLIVHAPLDAFDRREIEVIAHVARYHRRAEPKAGHSTFAALRPWQQRTVRKLAALLRIADALDRSHAQRVREIYVAIRKKSVRVEVISPYDVDLELEAAAQRGRLFRRVFGRKLRFRQGLETS